MTNVSVSLNMLHNTEGILANLITKHSVKLMSWQLRPGKHTYIERAWMMSSLLCNLVCARFKAATKLCNMQFSKVVNYFITQPVHIMPTSNFPVAHINSILQLVNPLVVERPREKNKSMHLHFLPFICTETLEVVVNQDQPRQGYSHFIRLMPWLFLIWRREGTSIHGFEIAPVKSSNFSMTSAHTKGAYL